MSRKTFCDGCGDLMTDDNTPQSFPNGSSAAGRTTLPNGSGTLGFFVRALPATRGGTIIIPTEVRRDMDICKRCIKDGVTALAAQLGASA